MLPQHLLASWEDKCDTKIGSGFYGSVYNHKYNLNYVIKRTNNLELNEVIVLKHLQHKNIVKMVDYAVFENTTFIVMERAVGSLDKIIDKLKANPVLALKVLSQICDALHYIHSNGVVHLDLKPNNILYDFNERFEVVPKIADFGLARPESVPSSALYTAFIPPEVYLYEDIRAAASMDIWMLSLTIYELFCEENFWRNCTRLEFLESVLSRSRPSDCPKEIKLVLDKLWRTNAEDRPSALEAKHMIDKLVTELKG